MNEVTIICRRPGMRRNGVAHPETATYPGDHWSDEQLRIFHEDPYFEIAAAPEGPSKESTRDGDEKDLGPEDPVERIKLIQVEVPKLKPDDLTKTGRPKIPALEKVLGWKPTADEIDKAIAEPDAGQE